MKLSEDGHHFNSSQHPRLFLPTDSSSRSPNFPIIPSWWVLIFPDLLNPGLYPVVNPSNFSFPFSLFQISGIVLAPWVAGAVLTGDYLATDPNEVVPEIPSLDSVVELLSRTHSPANLTTPSFIPTHRRPHWLSLEDIHQCSLCLRFHGISWYVTRWAHEGGLIGGECLTEERLERVTDSRIGHNICEPDNSIIIMETVIEISSHHWINIFKQHYVTLPLSYTDFIFRITLTYLHSSSLN